MWEPPTERENGDPLPLTEIKGYNLYWSSSTVTDRLVFVQGGGTTEYQTPVLPEDQYCVKIQTVDINDVVSQISPQECIDLDGLEPGMPANIKLEVNVNVEVNVNP